MAEAWTPEQVELEIDGLTQAIQRCGAIALEHATPDVALVARDLEIAGATLANESRHRPALSLLEPHQLAGIGTRCRAARTIVERAGERVSIARSEAITVEQLLPATRRAG